MYHVVGATALSTDLSDGQTITTLQGDDVTVTINADGVFINDALVTVADLVADNGVVHVINAVLLPNAVSTEEPFYAKDIKLMPNPVSTTLRLDLPEELAGNAMISIWSAVGQRVWQGNSSGDTQWIDVTDMAKGLYIMQIQQNEVSISRKIMVY
ncbi:MAG: fasciclin domain-containing protein [Saprospiraceae bacterium]